MTVMDFPGTVVPERTVEQRAAALLLANRTRSRRAQLKRDMKAGRVSAVDVILDTPGYAETMKLYDLLMAIPKVGKTNANKVLVQSRCSPAKTLGGLSERQRGEIAERLRR